MGKVYSLLLRPIRTFNVENRAERVISKEKPKPAPQYSSIKKQRELVNKLKPDFMKDHYEKNSQLHDYLKNVYVQSKDEKSIPTEESVSTDSLPQDSSLSCSHNYEHSKKLMITGGKCSLQNAIHFISMHSKNPTEYSVETISDMYKLDKQVVENIITNFKVFNLLKRKEINKYKLSEDIERS